MTAAGRRVSGFFFMHDIEQLCDRCGAHGVNDILAHLGSRADMEVLASACFARAKRVENQGNSAVAERLFAAGQFLSYLALPYDDSRR